MYIKLIVAYRIVLFLHIFEGNLYYEETNDTIGQKKAIPEKLQESHSW
jgi:hypothetical protein